MQIRLIQERLEYHKALNERRETILKSIDDQGKLTAETKLSSEVTDIIVYLDTLGLDISIVGPPGPIPHLWSAMDWIRGGLHGSPTG